MSFRPPVLRASGVAGLGGVRRARGGEPSFVKTAGPLYHVQHDHFHMHQRIVRLTTSHRQAEPADETAETRGQLQGVVPDAEPGPSASSSCSHPTCKSASPRGLWEGTQSLTVTKLQDHRDPSARWDSTEHSSPAPRPCQHRTPSSRHR